MGIDTPKNIIEASGKTNFEDAFIELMSKA
jgi:hypothetical protein